MPKFIFLLIGCSIGYVFGGLVDEYIENGL